MSDFVFHELKGAYIGSPMLPEHLLSKTAEPHPGVTRKMVDEALVALHSEWESRPRNDERFFAEFMLEQAARARAEVAALKTEAKTTTRPFRDTIQERIKKDHTFRPALLKEALAALRAGEVSVGRSIFREDCVDVSREIDGLWIVEVPDLPGVLEYGTTLEDALIDAESLALRVTAEKA